MTGGRLAALATTTISATMLYWDVAGGLVRAWWTDPNNSHGFLIVPMSAYFVYERRRQLGATPLSPSLMGMAVVAAGLLFLVSGQLAAELFLTRISMIVVAAGAVLFIAGQAHLKILALPLAFLLLMVPLPAILFNEIALPLQMLASRVAEITLTTLGIPVLREGNVIVLANATLEIAEACSGIRSLIALITLGIVYGHFTERRQSRRVMLVLATVPIAVVTNAARVAGTGVAAHVFGAAAAEGFFHTFAGWLVFLAAAAMLFVVQRLFADSSSAALLIPVTTGVAS